MEEKVHSESTKKKGFFFSISQAHGKNYYHNSIVEYISEFKRLYLQVSRKIYELSLENRASWRDCA